MLNVSEKFYRAMKSNLFIPKLRGTIDGVPFTEADILQGSFRVCGQCVDVSAIALGGVFVGELRLTLLPHIATDRGGWVGREIFISYGLDTGDGVEFIPCPSGFYYINSATWTANGLEIIAYDSIGKLDKTYTGEQSSGTAYDWLTFIATKTGVKIGNTPEEVAQMPNGLQQLGLYNTDEVQTFRDLLMFLSAALCGFATCGRDGSIVIKSFGSQIVDTIDEFKRYAGAGFSDYVTRYTGLSIVDIETKELVYYHIPEDTGLTMKLGSNPFLQFGTKIVKDEMRKAVLNGLQSFAYTPYNATLLGCCAYDLGDVIRFDGGLAAGAVGCIMSYDFGLNDFSINGYGDNPALLSAQTKLDKEVAGIISSQEKELATVTSLTNINELGISEEWNKIGELSFAVSKAQSVLFHAAVKLNIEQSGLVRFMYRLNGDVVDFIHESYVTELVDTVTLFIPLPIEANLIYDFEVFIQSDTVTGTVNPYDVRGAVFGVGVVTSNWDGTIELEDKFKLELGGDLIINFVDNAPVVDFITPEVIALTDAFALELGGDLAIEFAADVNIITQTGIFDLITQDGRPLTTETGDPYITNGGKDGNG